MVDRGTCSFVTKTRHVQNLGGHLALIINNEDGPVTNIMLNDDGTGSDIVIPALLISKEDGQKIKEFFMENKDDSSVLGKIVVSAEFIIVL
jgi:extracellular elastinolytic metalloproteinase